MRLVVLLELAAQQRVVRRRLVRTAAALAGHRGAVVVVLRGPVVLAVPAQMARPTRAAAPVAAQATRQPAMPVGLQAVQVELLAAVQPVGQAEARLPMLAATALQGSVVVVAVRQPLSLVRRLVAGVTVPTWATTPKDLAVVQVVRVALTVRLSLRTPEIMAVEVVGKTHRAGRV